MKSKLNNYQVWTIILALLFLMSYFLQDILNNIMWIFPSLILAIAFILAIIIAIIKKVKHAITIFICTVLIITTSEIVKSEIFKSPKVLQAILHDDLSAIHLTLRKNKTFEISSTTIFSEEKYKGDYKISGNKIIFSDRPYQNNFIPDTVTIWKDKIILSLDKAGQPNIDFANYFDIEENHLEKIE